MNYCSRLFIVVMLFLPFSGICMDKHARCASRIKKINRDKEKNALKKALVTNSASFNMQTDEKKEEIPLSPRDRKRIRNCDKKASVPAQHAAAAIVLSPKGKQKHTGIAKV